MTEPVKRRYRTTVARGDAPAAILDAAALLFADHGYHRVSIMDIATTANVARPTVYAAVGTKPDIFNAVLRQAITGSNLPGDAEDQEWFHATLRQPTAADVLSAQAHDVRKIGERVARLYWAAEIAAAADDTVAALWKKFEEGRYRAAHLVAAEIAQRPESRYDAGFTADLIFTVLSPANYRTLVLDRGRTPQQFQDWATETLCATLLTPADAPARRRT